MGNLGALPSGSIGRVREVYPGVVVALFKEDWSVTLPEMAVESLE